MAAPVQDVPGSPEDNLLKTNVDAFLKQKKVKELLDKCKDYCSKFGMNLKENDVVDVFDTSCWKTGSVQKIYGYGVESYAELKINSWATQNKTTKVTSPEIKPLWTSSKLDSCYQLHYFSNYETVLNEIESVS